MFASFSLLPIVVLGWWINSQLRSTADKQALRSYQRATRTLVAPLAATLGDLDAETTLTAATREDLLEIERIVVADRPTVRLRLISPTGRVAYTSLDSDRALLRISGWVAPTTDATLRTADAADEGMTAVTGPVFVSRLAVKPAGDAAVGWFEVTAPVSLVVQADDAELGRERSLLVGGLAALWVLMVPVFWSVARRLKRQVDENERLAQHDALTGLPNRTLLASRLTEALTESAQHRSVVGLMLIDLDDFKDVNDTLGHQAGDVLLRHVAQRIKHAVRPGDTVGRLGGDEFAVVVANAQHPSVISGVAERLLDALERPVQIGEVQVTPGASIGIALSPEHGTTVDVLMQRADIAMYAAKAGGLGRRTYSSTIDSHSPSRLGLTSELRAGLRTDDQIDLVYQPIVDTRTGAVVQFETLVRWKHPQRGELLPKDFLEMAERSGLVAQLTERTLAVALRQLRTWLDAGLEVRVGMNLSSIVLRDQTLPGQISSMLNHLKIPASLLEFEVTETSLLEEPEAVLVLLRQLRSLGSTVALDDFGSGFSSLAHLRSLEADALKIDRQFVEHVLTSARDATIVSSVIDLSHRLGMTVTAEGVETAGQAEHLAKAGCDKLQGFYLARPLPAHAATALLRERSRSRAGVPATAS
jgi:diguanylate cyclase (GGDEF)-like protein